MILFLLICVLLCGLLWLFYAWCDLGRILAGLYEMKCLQEEWNSEHDQCDGKTTEPASERDKRVRLHVKLRRKAFLLRRNADKLAHLLFKARQTTRKQLAVNNSRTPISPTLHVGATRIVWHETVKQALKRGLIHAFDFVFRNRRLGIKQDLGLRAHMPNYYWLGMCSY